MNFKPLIKAKIEDFGKNFPELSTGEIIFAGIATYKKTNDFTKVDLLEISDSALYEGLSKYYASEIVGRESDSFTEEEKEEIRKKEEDEILKRESENFDKQ